MYVHDRAFARLGAYKRAEELGRLRRPTCAPQPLDCAEVQYRAFRVVPPDPHGFDGDADGVGCES